MLDVSATLIDIIDRVPYTYNTNEGWVVKKMKPKHVNRIATNFPIIYQKNKVQYFSNKFAMMISKAFRGKSINKAIIMYFQLVKELIRWGECQKKMIEETAKREP
jgi:Holliday junction resolvase RusA-like endonuclease